MRSHCLRPYMDHSDRGSTGEAAELYVMYLGENYIKAARVIQSSDFRSLEVGASLAMAST